MKWTMLTRSHTASPVSWSTHYLFYRYIWQRPLENCSRYLFASKAAGRYRWGGTKSVFRQPSTERLVNVVITLVYWFMYTRRDRRFHYMHVSTNLFYWNITVLGALYLTPVEIIKRHLSYLVTLACCIAWKLLQIVLIDIYPLRLFV